MNQSVDFGINLQLTGAQQVATGTAQAAQGLDKVEAELAGVNASGKASADTLQAILGRLSNIGTAAGNAGRGASTAAAGMGKLGEATKLTGQQTAQLSAQLQDFFVQVQAGGNPLTALIQQGSQLSAVFGGFGNAFKAVGSLLSPTVIAIGAAAAAVGTLAYAFVAGKNEAAELARTLAITGNAAGLTSQRFTAMAETIAQQTNTSIGSARETLLGLAASGQLSGDAFAKTAEAVQRLAKATGGDAADISKQFLGLVDNVAKGAQELNRRFNFLTADQYAYIKSLEDTGQSSKALSVAMEALNARIGDQTQNLGPLARLWDTFTRSMSAANNAAKSVSRDSPLVDQFAALQRQIEQNEAAANSRAGRRRSTIEEQNDALRQQLAQVRGLLDLEEQRAKRAAEVAAQAKAGIAFQGLADQFKTPNEKLDELRQKIINVGIEAGLSGDRIGAVVQQATTYSQANAQAVAAAQAAVGAQAAIAAAKLSATIEGLQAQAELGQIRQIDLIGKVAEAQFKAAKAEEDRLRKSISLAASLPNNSAQVVALQGQLAAQAVQTAQIQKKATDDVAIAYRKQALALRDAMAALREQGEGEINSQVQQQQQQRNALINAVQDYTESLKEAAEVAGVELKAMQYSDKEREIALRQLQIELGLRRQLKAINATPFDSQDDRQAQIDKATAAARAASEAVVDEVTAKFVTKGAQDIQEAVLNAFEGGFDSALASLKRMLKREVYRVTIEPYIQQGSQWLSALINGAAGASGASAGGQGAGYMQTAQTLTSLYGYGKAAYGWLTGAGTAAGAGAASLGGSTAAYTTMANSQTLAAYGVTESAAAAGTAGAASSASWIPYVGWAIAALTVSLNAWKQGFTNQNTDNKAIDSGAAGALGLFGPNYVSRGLDSLGIGNSKWNQIFSGAAGLNYLFGRGAPQIKAQGVTGSFTGGEFTGQAFQDVFQKGGLFRSDKNSTNFAQLPEAIGKFLDEAGKSVLQQAKDYGKALGLPAESLAAVTKDIRVELTDDADKNKEALLQALSGYGEALVAGYAEAVKPLAQLNETTAQTIERVATALTGVNDVLKAIGISALQSSVQGGAAAIALQDLFGGIGGLQQAASGYLQNYFTESERAALATKALGEALGQVGLALPATRDEFKSLVSAQDLTTESGRAAFAALMSVADAFAQIVPAARSAADIAAERYDLQGQLLQLQGDEAALRARERAKLDPSNVDLFDQINAFADQKKAAEAEKAKAAAEAAALTAERAQWAAFYADMEAKASQARKAWTQVWGGITDEIKRLRGLAAGTTPAGNLAEFASTTAAARAGDLEAARRLPELSQKVSADIEAGSRTREEQSLKLATLAASLDRTLVESSRSANGGGTLVALPDEVVAMFARIAAAQEKGTSLLDDIASGTAVVAMEQTT